MDTVFIGSCTNGRIEDLRAAADVLRGRQVRPAYGSSSYRLGGGQDDAEQEGLDEVFAAAGAEWRRRLLDVPGHEPGQADPGERSASTSNRNFEGRQGPGGRTHLVSPPVAAATAITGRLTAPADSDACRKESNHGSLHHAHRSLLPLRRSNVDTDQIIPPNTSSG